ncbi:MAG: threonine-phosphate decarboxylase CobD [Nitrososphaerales archaeon]
MRIENLAKEHIRNLKPCIHGGEVWQLEFSKKNILDFSANVNPLGPSPKAINAIIESFWKIPFYPDSNNKSVKEAISKSIGISPENLIIGNGSTEIIYLFSEVFVKEDERVLIPAPTFGEYEMAVLKANGKIEYLYLTHDFKIDVNKFIEKMKGVKVAFLCNPNNPTGLLIPFDDLIKIVDKAEKNNTLIFVDEDFMDFAPKEKCSSLIREIDYYQNLFIIKSFTKFFGLTGLRIGYGIGNKEAIEIMSRVKIPWNVNCLAEAAAIATLTDSEFLDKTYRLIEEEREFLMDELSQIKGFYVIPSDANFFLINIKKTGLKAKELKSKLLKFGILIRDCDSFKGLDEYYIRVAIRTRKENEYLIEALKKVINYG